MSYRFKHGESHGVRRIALELIDYILGQLKDKTNNRDNAIYEARKSFKQLRALLQLIRAETGEKFYQKTNRFYRGLALQLAPLRDAFVIIEALDKLELDTKLLRKALKKDYKAIRLDLLKDGGAVSQVISLLEEHRPSIESWNIPSDKFKLLKKGLEQSYREGKEGLKLAYKANTTEGFHEWRKAVKTLWYHSRLLEASNPETLSAYVTELKMLSDYLGNANDFALLESYLAEHEAVALIPHIQEKRLALLADARPLGKALYKEEKAKFVKKNKLAWKKWQANAA